MRKQQIVVDLNPRCQKQLGDLWINVRESPLDSPARKEAEEDFATRYRGQLISTAQKRLTFHGVPDLGLAEDYSHEALVEVFALASQPRCPSTEIEARCWLFTKVNDKVITEVRRRQTKVGSARRLSGEVTCSGFDSVAEIDDEDTRNRQLKLLADGVDQLPQMQRKVVILYLEGRTRQEIAQELSSTEEAVTRNLHRVREKLKSCLSDVAKRLATAVIWLVIGFIVVQQRAARAPQNELEAEAALVDHAPQAQQTALHPNTGGGRLCPQVVVEPLPENEPKFAAERDLRLDDMPRATLDCYKRRPGSLKRELGPGARLPDQSAVSNHAPPQPSAPCTGGEKVDDGEKRSGRT